MGSRTPQKTGTLFCGVLYENTNFPDKIVKVWTPLGIRLVTSFINCVLL